jgi:hypothetical protein
MAKKSILGLLCMSALSLCAFASFGVASASATTMHQCEKKATGPTEKTYTDEFCQTEEPSGKGAFRTVPIAANTSVGLTATLTPTAGTEEIHAVMKGILHGIAYEITCTGAENGSVATTAKNVEEGTVMKVTGTGSIKFTGCSMKGEAATLGCAVTASIETVELSSTSIDEMGGVMKAEYKPVPSTTFVGIVISGCTGAAAILNGTQNVKGHADSTTTTPTSQTFNTGAGELTFGGAEANFKATIHYKTTSNGKTVAFETNSEGK